jgi:DNA mismatch repair protein MLH3
MHRQSFQPTRKRLMPVETSKHGAPENFHGQNGTFLASLGSLALTTVISRHHQYRSTNGLTLFRSDVVSRMTPCSETQGLRSGSYGTRVLVRDLFGDMPVRVKRRAAQVADQIELDRTWNELKLDIVALMVAWPAAVGIRLVDESNRRTIVIPAQTSLPSQSGRGSMSTRLPHIAKHANMLPSAQAHSWIPASASSRRVQVTGAIALEPVATKQLQFLSIGVRPLATRSHERFYAHINRLFGSSCFGTVDDDHPNDQTPKRSRKVVLVGNRSKVDRWPMFDLRITLRDDARQANSLDEYTLNAVEAVLDALVSSWLSTHHFKLRPDRPRTKTSEQTDLCNE